MIASIEITNTEIFAFIAVLVYELLSRKVLFISRKDFTATFYYKIINSSNAKFSGYF